MNQSKKECTFSTSPTIQIITSQKQMLKTFLRIFWWEIMNRTNVMVLNAECCTGSFWMRVVFNGRQTEKRRRREDWFVAFIWLPWFVLCCVVYRYVRVLSTRRCGLCTPKYSTVLSVGLHLQHAHTYQSSISAGVSWLLTIALQYHRPFWYGWCENIWCHSRFYIK